MQIDKWSWMMDWCKERMLPPANSEVWRIAEQAYDTKMAATNAFKEKANG